MGAGKRENFGVSSEAMGCRWGGPAQVVSAHLKFRQHGGKDEDVDEYSKELGQGGKQVPPVAGGKHGAEPHRDHLQAGRNGKGVGSGGSLDGVWANGQEMRPHVASGESECQDDVWWWPSVVEDLCLLRVVIKVQRDCQ